MLTSQYFSAEAGKVLVHILEDFRWQDALQERWENGVGAIGVPLNKGNLMQCLFRMALAIWSMLAHSPVGSLLQHA